MSSIKFKIIGVPVGCYENTTIENMPDEAKNWANILIKALSPFMEQIQSVLSGSKNIHLELDFFLPHPEKSNLFINQNTSNTPPFNSCILTALNNTVISVLLHLKIIDTPLKITRLISEKRCVYPGEQPGCLINLKQS